MAQPGESTKPVDAVTLRANMVDSLRARGVLASDGPIERALRIVARHAFLPDVPVAKAYGPGTAVVIKRAPDGTALSSASAPAIVAAMLDQLDVRPGEHVLEIGAATGYNAALLGELVSPGGHVVTVEYDQDLADRAAEAISRTGYSDRVDVRAGDGALGAPDRAPFDAIVVTAGAADLPGAWWDQLTPTGRMIVPLQLHPSGVTRSLRLHRTGPNTAVSIHQVVCGFVPLRGRSATATTRTRLTANALLHHAPTAAVDADVLGSALDAGPAWRTWTGLTFSVPPASALHLDLWLASGALPYGRLVVSDAVRASGVADPSRRWGAATVFRGGSLAYLTTRPGSEGRGEEIGVAAHGADAERLGHELVAAARVWHAGPRLREPTVTVVRRSDDTILHSVRW